MDRSALHVTVSASLEFGSRWLPPTFVHDLGHFDFNQLDSHRRRIRWEKMRDFAVQLMSAESDYFAANLGTKKSKDVKAAYTEADVKVTDLLRRHHTDRQGALIRICGPERDLLAQLRKYIQMRQQMVQLYRDAVSTLHDGPLDYRDISDRIRTIMDSMLGYLQHSELLPLRCNAEYELTILRLLFEALHHIALFQARDAIHHIQRARTTVTNWKVFQRRSKEQPLSPKRSRDSSLSEIPSSSSGTNFWDRGAHRSLQSFLASLGQSGFLSYKSPPMSEAFHEERTMPIPIADEAQASASLAVSPPCTPFVPLISTCLSQASKVKGEQEADPKLDVDNKLIEWLSGAISRALAKYTFVFQEVLLASRLRLYPKDRYQYPENKGCTPLDLLGPVTGELKRAFRIPSSSSNISPISSLQPHIRPNTPGAPSLNALLTRVEIARPLALTEPQLDPIKRMVEFVKANPACTLVVLLDTSKMDSFSMIEAHPLDSNESGNVQQSIQNTNVAAETSASASNGASPMEDPPSDNRLKPVPEVVHVDCCKVTFCQRALGARGRGDSSESGCSTPGQRGIEAFHIIVQHPRGGPVDLTRDLGLKATVVSLILSSQHALAQEAAPHQGRVLHIPPSGTDDRCPFSLYLSQLDQVAYACIISEKAKEKGKNVHAYLSRLTDSLRDSNQLGYLVTPKFDYEKNLI